MVQIVRSVLRSEILPELNDIMKRNYDLLRSEIMTTTSSPATPAVGYAVGDYLPEVDAVRLYSASSHRHHRVRDISKAARYAREFKKKAEFHHFEINRPMDIRFSHEEGLQICYRGQIAWRCDASHIKIKSAYFAFGLCNYNYRTFKDYMDSIDGNFPDQEVSPENTLLLTHPN